MLVNINKVKKLVNINNPTASNETATITKHMGENYDVSINEMIVPQMNQIDNHPQSEGNILTIGNESLSINNNNIEINLLL